jgi:hypothetical protein
MPMAFRQTKYDTHTDKFGLTESNMRYGPYEIRVLPRSVPENRSTAGHRDVAFIKYFVLFFLQYVKSDWGLYSSLTNKFTIY